MNARNGLIMDIGEDNLTKGWVFEVAEEHDWLDLIPGLTPKEVWTRT